MTISTGKRVLEFPIADPVFIAMFKEILDYPHFDITLGKKVKYMTMSAGIHG